jgi:GNAT superfamily N-acetyltransferase
LIVRAARPEDADSIGRIHTRAWQVAYRGLIPDSVLDARDAVESALQWRRRLEQERTPLLVAESSSQVVGFCSLGRARDPDLADPSVGEIHALYVHPEAWREGAGRCLLEAAREVGQDVGYATLVLWVLESNLRARRFYEHLGLQPDGAHKSVPIAEGVELLEVRYRGPVA